MSAYIYEEILNRLSLNGWGISVQDTKIKSWRRQDDLLWKAVLEDLFEDFLRFFFPNDLEKFELSRGFSFLDKEFDELFPSEGASGVRFVDKLVKVYLRDGRSNFFLIHVEIQGQKGKEDFGMRMFRYFYRVKDRYGVPVAALAILIDGQKGFHPKVYREDWLDTRLSYEFRTYKVLEQSEEALKADANPFALVILIVHRILKNKKGKTNEEQLLAMKKELVKELMDRNMDKDRRRKLFNFLNRAIRFKSEETTLRFNNELVLC